MYGRSALSGKKSVRLAFGFRRRRVSKKSIKSDLDRLDRMKDIDYSDIPALDNSFFAKPIIDWPPTKQQVTVRLPTDVLDWLKAYGKG